MRVIRYIRLRHKLSLWRDSSPPRTVSARVGCPRLTSLRCLPNRSARSPTRSSSALTSFSICAVSHWMRCASSSSYARRPRARPTARARAGQGGGRRPERAAGVRAGEREHVTGARNEIATLGHDACCRDALR